MINICVACVVCLCCVVLFFNNNVILKIVLKHIFQYLDINFFSVLLFFEVQ